MAISELGATIEVLVAEKNKLFKKFKIMRDYISLIVKKVVEVSDINLRILKNTRFLAYKKSSSKLIDGP